MGASGEPTDKKLILLVDDEQLGEYPLDRDVLIVGRQPSSNIFLDDATVSGSHARILTILHDSFVEDLGSTNGTKVNDEPVERHVLEHGDVVSIGRYRLRFEHDQHGQHSSGKTIAAELPAAIPHDHAHFGKAWVRLLSGAERGKELALAKALTTVGKPGGQVAAISRRPQGDFIMHVEGGDDDGAVPMVNGVSIGYRSRMLHDRDVIEVAGVLMEYLQHSPDR